MTSNHMTAGQIISRGKISDLNFSMNKVFVRNWTTIFSEGYRKTSEKCLVDNLRFIIGELVFEIFFEISKDRNLISITVAYWVTWKYMLFMSHIQLNKI